MVQRSYAGFRGSTCAVQRSYVRGSEVVRAGFRGRTCRVQRSCAGFRGRRCGVQRSCARFRAAEEERVAGGEQPRGPPEGRHQHGPVRDGGRDRQARAGGARPRRQLGLLPPHAATHHLRRGRPPGEAVEDER